MKALSADVDFRGGIPNTNPDADQPPGRERQIFISRDVIPQKY
jgi:hypothetical protein